MRQVDRWAALTREHFRIVADFDSAIERMTVERWYRPLGPQRWSPAALTSHVIQAYDLGRMAMSGGASMRLIAPRPVAWLARNVALPIFLARGTFPKGGEAPVEVRPDLLAAASLSQTDARDMLRTAANASIAALRAADGASPPRFFVHAYFGRLNPLLTARLVSAHTRHHLRALEDLPPVHE